MRYLLFLLLIFRPADIPCQVNGILWSVAWSPDDRYVAVGGDQGDLKIFDGTTFELLKKYPVKDVVISRVKWHPRLYKLAVVTQSDSFKAKILDIDQDEWTDLDGLETSLRGLDWNATGKYLAVSEFEGEVSIFDNRGQLIKRIVADPKSVTGLDWHPSKDIIVTVGSQIALYNLEGETIKKFQPRKEEAFLLCVEWHQSGDFFAVGDYGYAADAKQKLIQYWTIDGELISQLEGSEGEYRNIRWNPVGSKLASASDALRIWDVQGDLIASSKSNEDYLWGIDWNATGSQIITSSAAGVIRIWDDRARLIREIKYD